MLFFSSIPRRRSQMPFQTLLHPRRAQARLPLLLLLAVARP
jgi:hypothetical protein